MNQKLQIESLQQRIVRLLKKNNELTIKNKKLRKKVEIYKNMIDLFIKGKD